MATLASAGSLSIGYKGKMFKQPECKFQLAHVIPEGESPEETKLIEAAYKKLFETGFAKLEKERAAAIKKAMDETEKQIAKKPPSNMDAFLATANKLIQQGIDVWRQVEVPRLAAECLENVYKAVESKLKKKLQRKQVKTVLKIVALVLITLAVAAVSIAATVLTGGALAPLVAAAVVTGVGALIASGKTIKKGYDDYHNFLGKIEADIEKIDKAVAYQEKKAPKLAAGVKLGPKEKVKLMFATTGGDVKALKKHLADAEASFLLARKGMHKALIDAGEAAENLAKLESHPSTAVSGEAKKAKADAYLAARKLEKFEEKKKQFDELKAQANAQMAMLESKGEWDGGKLSKLVRFAQDHEDTANFLISAGSTLKTAATKLAKAVG